MQPIVLLVDDDDIVRAVIQNTLAREGFLVIPACDGEEAMQMSGQLVAIDILVTDVYMGQGMSGIELSERLLTERPGLRVLVISANLEYQPVAHGNPLQFLRKPFSAATLLHRVR